MTEYELREIIDHPQAQITLLDGVYFIVIPGIIKLRLYKSWLFTKKLNLADMGPRTMAVKSPLWSLLKKDPRVRRL